MKHLRLILKIAVLLLIGFVLYVNIRLYDLPVCDPAEGGALNVDAVKQLQFLKRQLHEGDAAEDMQQQYPEGFVFTYALYALAWCDVTAVCRPETVRRQEGLREVAFSLDALDAPAGKQVFNRELPLPYGAFSGLGILIPGRCCLGWAARLLLWGFVRLFCIVIGDWRCLCTPG